MKLNTTFAATIAALVSALPSLALGDTVSSFGETFPYAISTYGFVSNQLQVGVSNKYSDVFSIAEGGYGAGGKYTNTTVWSGRNDRLKLAAIKYDRYGPDAGPWGTSINDDLFGAFSRIGESHAWANTDPLPYGSMYAHASAETGWRDVVTFHHATNDHVDISFELLMEASVGGTGSDPSLGAYLSFTAALASANYGEGLLGSVGRRYWLSKPEGGWYDYGGSLLAPLRCSGVEGGCLVSENTMRLVVSVPVDTPIVMYGSTNLVANTGGRIDASGTNAVSRLSVQDGVTWESLGGATYIYAPVPEPETYAMLLAGLGLMGAVARRRTQQK